jgi:hypothetical protein
VRSLRALLAGACLSFALAPTAVGDTVATPSGSTQAPNETLASSQPPQAGTPVLGKGAAAATLEQCATAVAPQTERSATFAGEMAATASTVRMEMRIELEELDAGTARYHTVSAPGLGVWQRSLIGVKSFTHIQQVTNLSVPATYRAAIHFRWLGVRGRLIKSAELRTSTCEQPAEAPSTGAPAATG